MKQLNNSERLVKHLEERHVVGKKESQIILNYRAKDLTSVLHGGRYYALSYRIYMTNMTYSLIYFP